VNIDAEQMDVWQYVMQILVVLPWYVINKTNREYDIFGAMRAVVKDNFHDDI